MVWKSSMNAATATLLRRSVSTRQAVETDLHSLLFSEQSDTPIY